MTGPDLYTSYVESLRRHAHCLIAEGYALMDGTAFSNAKEPVITGELVLRIQGFLESPTAPGWVAHYKIAEDPPLNVEGKQGNTRPRVDIEFERVCRGARPKLRFEAKRLNAAHSYHGVSNYLGRDGLGCFTSGRYPLTHNEAGMLGYVQSDSESVWANRIHDTLIKNIEKYSVIGEPFSPQQIHRKLRHTYISRHSREESSSPISVFHVLLLFTLPETLKSGT